MLDMNAYLPILNRICEEAQQNMASKKEGHENDSDVKMDWNCRVEMLLFYAMLGLKPVGVNRHFMMTCIHQRFTSLLKKEISSKAIWDYLESLYDMTALHESEIMPFPNEEVDYDLPKSYYDLAMEQLGVSLQDDNESEDSKSDSNVKIVKKVNSSKSKQNGASSSKSVFLAPVSGKSIKALNKSEVKVANTPENNTKVKQESPFPSKVNKVKRSSSPLTTKQSKTEQTSVNKDESSDSPALKKLKSDNSTPVSSKKTPKAESSSLAKKSVKQDQGSGSKHSKTENQETPLKKVKSDKDSLNKKSKVGTPTEASNKKSSKPEGKKTDQELSKKVGDISSNKGKASSRSSSTSSKGTKHEDSDSSIPSGSRKSSSAVKVDINDKKKKKSSPTKRRRTTAV